MPNKPQYHVRAVHCDHRSSAEEIYDALARTTAPRTNAGPKLKRARRIGSKFSGRVPG